MFKDKTSKKRLNNTENYRDKCTLDTMHHDIIKDFENKSIKYNECLIKIVMWLIQLADIILQTRQ